MSEAMPMRQPRVCAILVSHNGARWLPELVAALSSQERAPDRLLAVDTGSTDGSAELLRNSRIEVIESDRESGFGSAVALAVNHLPQELEDSENQGEWLWLLHDDCAPAPDALAHLLEAVAQRPNVGMVGPKILGWHDRSHLLEIGVSIAHNGARWTGLERNERDQGQHDGDGIISVLAVSTAGALIRRDLFEEIGGFDENLPLFRDDVDFGMRAYMAGYTVLCATNARLFHAEAAATERRAIDVAGGALHRPHLLDRRHAAFVLLANLPLWTLPWITLRVFASAFIRASGYLLAKLPGYALDELAAVALLFTRIDRLRAARRARRKNRLLPARVIRPLLAPWSEQLKLGALRVRDLLLRRIERVPEPVAGNVFSDAIDESEEELLAPTRTRFWRQLLLRPLFVAVTPVLLITLIAARERFGSLAGGALAKIGNSAFDYLQIYGQSWHPLGLGSGRTTHPFTALLAIFSIITGGNPDLFVTLLFIAAPVIAILTMYLFARKSGAGKSISIAAGLVYAGSATLISALAVGYLSTALLIILLPLAALVMRPLINRQQPELTWRRSCVIAFMLTVLAALSFQVFVGMAIFLITHILFLSYQKVDRQQILSRLTKYGAILLGSFIGLAPWSFANILTPGQLLMDQGAPLPLSSPIRAMFENFQPLGSIPWFVVGASALIACFGLFSTNSLIDAVAILGALSLAALTSALALPAIGNSMTSQVWPGGFLSLALFFALRVLITLGDGRIRSLQQSSLGAKHIATALIAIFIGYSTAANLLWFATKAPQTPVRTSESSVLPAFIATATENPDRPKTLILRSESIAGAQSFAYVVLRERDVVHGELTSLPDQSESLTKVVREITAGAGDAPAASLAQFGIRYLYLENGRSNNSLARKIDSIGGLTRLSATSEGILWEVSGLSSRIRFIPEDDGSEEPGVSAVPSELVGAEFDLAGPGVLQLAESFDSRWRILQGGTVLRPEQNELGLTEFRIPEAGRAVLFHDGTIHRAGISAQLAVIGLLLFFALPRGRRQSERADEEVA